MLTSESNAMIATSSIFMILSGLSVILRIWVRKWKKANLKVDDYFVITAWVCSAVLAIIDIVGVPVGGFGEPFSSLSEAKGIIYNKLLLLGQFWYFMAVGSIKISILCFYGRIFGVGQYPISVKILLGISVLWFISFFFATLFQTLPLNCNWHACASDTMANPIMYVLSSVTDIIIDISILCLPVFFIRKLHLSGNQKVGIGAIFGLGVFCVVSSAARLVCTVLFYLAETGHPGFDINFNTVTVNTIMWSGIEACASVICANLPCYGPLLQTRGIETIIASLRSFLSIRTTRHSRRTASTENMVSLEADVENHIEGRSRKAISVGKGADIELGAIQADNSVNVDFLIIDRPS